ncbi:hypothetical protein JR316_0004091 [Psilocybe cubensis]|uniref:Uncharacterized protein n=2 Tax=Psilocybe cubensis TaxID=181762 RepID=A0ACB8HBM9_PSICU|nr:hypothetical protein JR316_0004091 [Psilocybe cubensis]KAH9484609.1 hypothetical protein JR316_0004091 [Psilocybe cubensis]
MSTHPAFFFDSTVPHFATDSKYRQMFDTVPLTFDRVHQGHIASSAFPLFKLPVELFGHVTKYLSIKDLKALALVDRDCYKLAALSQYRTLQIEARIQAPGAYAFSHGQCVRRLNVIPPPWGKDSAVPSLGRPPCHTGTSLFLPNLSILNWDGPSFTADTILECMRTSSVQHLRIRGAVVKSLSTTLPLISTPCPLETLSLDIDWSDGDSSQGNVLLTEHLLRAFSPHLRQLIWKGRQTRYNDTFTRHLPSFPRLRSLVLDSVLLHSEDALYHLFGNKTCIDSLSVDTASPANRAFLRTCGSLPTLQHFSAIHDAWSDCLYQDLLTFLEHNDHLETVHIAHPIPPTDMDLRLLPILNQYFGALTSLRLVFDDIDISQQSLQTISSITTLKQLWLSAGNQGFRSTWVIRHHDILKYLKPLTGIETLAFSQDTYITPNPHVLSPRIDYYASKALPVGVDIAAYLTSPENLLYEGHNVDYETGISQQAQMREQAWERWHADCMLTFANQYSQAFLSLRWCFLGQLAFSGDNQTGFAVVDTKLRREPCLVSLRKKMSIDIWRPE